MKQQILDWNQIKQIIIIYLVRHFSRLLPYILHLPGKVRIQVYLPVYYRSSDDASIERMPHHMIHITRIIVQGSDLKIHVIILMIKIFQQAKWIKCTPRQARFKICCTAQAAAFAVQSPFSHKELHNYTAQKHTHNYTHKNTRACEYTWKFPWQVH